MSTLRGGVETPSGPERTCVVCRRRRSRNDLFRIARTPDGIRPDPAHDLPGRGAYICIERECIDRATQRGGGPLRRAFRGMEDDEVRAVTEAVEAALAAGTEHQRSNA